MKFLCALTVLCVLCGSCLPALSLDREAFTFTKYDLTVNIEPEQQRLGVRGKIRLRNDSPSPQKNLSLQISSSLHWSSIQFEGKAAEFTAQTYASDIDHTGALTEAIVTLPGAIAPKQSIELAIGYEGVIPQDSTRLTRIGVPAEIASHSDWDQIGRSFTSVRGVGYVAWYPIGADASSLSEGNSVLETVSRWQQRESQAAMDVTFVRPASTGTGATLLCDGTNELMGSADGGSASSIENECTFDSLASNVPFFVLGNFETLEQPPVEISFLPDHKPGAENYALAVEETAPSINKWFGDHRQKPELKAEVIELPDPDAAPFESGNILLMPLELKDSALLLSAVQQLTHLAFPSPRTWIHDGLAHYAQLSFLQERGGRSAVLTYLQSHRDSLLTSELAAEKQPRAEAGDEPARHSLINSADEFYVQAKAMNVWWMLRDIVGEAALHAALHQYRAADDQDAYYMQKLIEVAAHRDLAWFFNDWIYRDRGLPDFHIVSVYPRQLLTGGYMLTVVVENLGEAAAEVPVIAHLANNEVSERLLVPGKSKASVRIQAATMAQDVTVNDGSVPESDMSNNVYKIEAPKN